MGLSEVLLAGHNALRAHGKAVQVIRAQAKTGAFVSAAQASKISIPVSDQLHDIEAARQHMFSVRNKHVFNNAWFSDPMLLGHYPEEGVELFAADMPELFPGDLEFIIPKLYSDRLFILICRNYFQGILSASIRRWIILAPTYIQVIMFAPLRLMVLKV